jgi:hypothetical protein
MASAGIRASTNWNWVLLSAPKSQSNEAALLRI